MAQKARPYRLTVKLTDAEHEALEARAAAAGVPMASVLRAAIAAEASRSPSPAEIGAPTRSWALARLAVMAAGGSVNATIALERALRLAGAPEPRFEPGPVNLDDLDDADLDAPALRVVR